MSLPTTKEKVEAAKILATIRKNLEIASPGPYPHFTQSAVFIYLGEKEFFVLSQACRQGYNFPADLAFRTICGVPFAVLNESSFFRISYSELTFKGAEI